MIIKSSRTAISNRKVETKTPPFQKAAAPAPEVRKSEKPQPKTKNVSKPSKKAEIKPVVKTESQVEEKKIPEMVVEMASKKRSLLDEILEEQSALNE